MAIDEIAVERELTNERVDLLQREGRRRAAFEIAAEEAVARDLELERRFRGVIRSDGAVFLCQGEHAEDAPHPGGALVLVDVGADGVEMRPGVAGARQQRQGGRGRAGRTIGVGDSMPAAGAAHVFAQEPPRFRIEQPDVEIGPLCVDALPDPAWWRRVVRGFDFDAAIEMHGAHAEAVVAKRLDR